MGSDCKPIECLFQNHLFQIKIWDMDHEDIVIYDNQVACSDGVEDADPCTEIGGGSIVVQKGKKYVKQDQSKKRQTKNLVCRFF